MKDGPGFRRLGVSGKGADWPLPEALGWKLESGMLSLAEAESQCESILRGLAARAARLGQCYGTEPLWALLSEYAEVRRERPAPEHARRAGRGSNARRAGRPRRARSLKRKASGKA